MIKYNVGGKWIQFCIQIKLNGEGFLNASGDRRKIMQSGHGMLRTVVPISILIDKCIKTRLTICVKSSLIAGDRLIEVCFNLPSQIFRLFSQPERGNCEQRSSEIYETLLAS